MSRALTQRIAILIVALALTFAASPAFATDCSNLPGTREATAGDDVVKNGEIAAGTCYNPNEKSIGVTDEAAKAYLRSLPRTGSAADDGNIAKLNNAFAKCAAKFLKDFTQRYGGVTISSAYRSPAYDAAMCRNNPACGNLMNNPNPQGNHQRGLAMDVWQGTQGSSDNAKIRDFAMQNPQYGVCFPFSVPGTGFYDRPHMILAGGPGSEGNGAGCRGVTRACDGSNFNPNDIMSTQTTAASAPTGVSASTGGTNATNPFANPYNPTQQGQMCMVSTDPIIMVPCNQQAQQFPQPQVPMPNYPQPQSSSQTSGSSVSTGGTIGSGPRFTPDFPLPTPNTSTFVVPPAYVYATATVSVPTNPRTTPVPATSSGNAPVRTTAPTQLNTDLQNVTGLSENAGYTDAGGLAVNTTDPTAITSDTPRATETFGNTDPVPNRATVSATGTTQTQSVIVAALTALRNLLVSYINLLKHRDSVGFQGAWQLPGTSVQY